MSTIWDALYLLRLLRSELKNGNILNNSLFNFCASGRTIVGHFIHHPKSQEIAHIHKQIHTHISKRKVSVLELFGKDMAGALLSYTNLLCINFLRTTTKTSKNATQPTAYIYIWTFQCAHYCTHSMQSNIKYCILYACHCIGTSERAFKQS